MPNNLIEWAIDFIHIAVSGLDMGERCYGST